MPFAVLAAALAQGGPPGKSAGAAEPGPLEVLELQAAAWNRGDIDAFMEYYWQSDRLTFSSGGKTTRGWAATREGYRRRYPDRQAMGTLRFDQLEHTPLGEDAALVLGRFRLERQSDAPSGSFSLVFQRFDGKWRIVHDHTSADPRSDRPE